MDEHVFALDGGGSSPRRGNQRRRTAVDYGQNSSEQRMSGDSEHIALGRGLYGVTELSHYVAFQAQRHVYPGDVSRWLAGALNPVMHDWRRPDYSFHDLVSLFVVEELVAFGVKPKAIKTAEAHLRDRYDMARPFASFRLRTDGVNVLYEASPLVRDQLTAANRGGQEVAVPIIEAALRDVIFEHSVAVRWEPAADIELDPAVQLGEPRIKGTRITTVQLAELAKRQPLDEIARWYDLSLQAVRHAVNFEERLVSAA